MSENQEIQQLRFFIPKRDKVYACISKLKSVKFGFLELGSPCDASKSVAFGSAHCNFKNIKNENDKHFTWNFTSLFDVGYVLLQYIKDRDPLPVTLPKRETEAIWKLEGFLDENGKN